MFLTVGILTCLILIAVFPRAFVVIVVMGIALVGIVLAKNYFDARQKDSISIIVDTVSASCRRPEYPFRITFMNGSRRTVDAVTFELSAFRSGHSTELAEANSFTSDRILEPGDTYSLCYQMPKAKANNNPADLLWNATVTAVTFR